MFKDLDQFIAALDKERELSRIADPVSPDLEISAVTDRASNCVGMRLAEVEDEKGLEIIRGSETDDETVATVTDVGKRMGREVVVIKDAVM